MTEKTPRTFWVAFAAFALLGSLWALASPLLSIPDENAHVAKAIGQVHGQLIGREVPGVPYRVMTLPDGYRYSNQLVCFAYHDQVTANCGVELGDATGTAWFNTWVGAYNPIYYYVVGWPSLFLSGSAGVYAMRIISAVASALFLAWAVHAALSVRRRTWMPFGLAFLASPMILFLAGSVNPNGIEISAAAALWMSVVRLLERHRQFSHGGYEDDITVSSRYLWVIATVSAVVLANARSLGPLWVIIVIAIGSMFVGWRSLWSLVRTRSNFLCIAIIGIGAIFSVIWTVATGTLSGQAKATDVPLVNGTFLEGFTNVLRLTPDYIQQAIGQFGWLDTSMPGLVYGVFLAALLLLVAPAFALARRRDIVSLAVLLIAAVLVPAIVQGLSVHSTGIIWQGRYGLYLYLAIPLFAAYTLSSSPSAVTPKLGSRLTVIGTATLWLYGMLTFVLVLRRYVVGVDKPIGAMFKDPQWEPPAGWIALVIAFAVISAALYAWFERLARSYAHLDSGSNIVSTRA